MSFAEKSSREDENPPTGSGSMSLAPGINLNLLPDSLSNSTIPPSQHLTGTRGVLSVTPNPTDNRTHQTLEGTEAYATPPSVQSVRYMSTPVESRGDHLVITPQPTPAENIPSNQSREHSYMPPNLALKKSSMAKSDQASTGKSKGNPISFSIEPPSP